VKLRSSLQVVVLAFSLVSFSAAPAQAGGPKRLSAALEALKNSQKQLEEAKEPPAALHEKSLAAVTKAIAAVEKEIQAYNDLLAAQKAKAAEPKTPEKADPKVAKPAAPTKPTPPAPAKPKPAPKPAAEETVD
jgi:septal ring factor EnvC (AmiA/AmiB activator)